MKFKVRIILIFFISSILSVIGMQCTPHNRFKSLNPSDDQGGNGLNNSAGSILSIVDYPLLSQSRCTEIVDGRILNISESTCSLDNSLAPPSDISKFNNISYQTNQGWDQDLSQLDVWTASSWLGSSKLRPVILYIHGDGSDASDKSDLYLFEPDYPRFLLQKGFVFVSTNYRVFLSDRSPNARGKDQVTDVSRAVKWIVDNISQFGGDPKQIVLLGMSHGAHISALLGADQKYFQQEGVPLDYIKGTISLDVPHYHIPLAIELLKGTYLEAKIPTVKYIYGESRDEQMSMSPYNYIKNNSYVKPALLISAGYKDSQKQTVSWPATVFYKNELLKNNHSVEHYHFDERNHVSLINADPNDEVTQVISNFLDRLFTKSNIPSFSNEQLSERQRVFDLIAKNFDSTITNIGGVYGYVSKEISIVATCGERNLLKKNSPSSFSTLFSIGSVSKLFPGLVLAKSVSDNIVKLSDPIGPLLPSSLRDYYTSSNLTLKRLVTHTSGLSLNPNNMLSRDLNGDGIFDSINSLNPAENYSIDNLIQCNMVRTTEPIPRCQADEVSKMDKYFYSNLGIGLLSLGLQDQGISKYNSFDRFFRANFSIPLNMEDSYAEASEIQKIVDNLSSKNLGNSDVLMAIDSFNERFAGLYNYSQSSSSAPIVTPQPDMGILAGAGEVKLSPKSMGQFLQLLAGYRTSKFYTSNVLLENQRVLFQDAQEKIGYASDIEQKSDGLYVFSKTGATKGSAAYLAWTPQNKSGMFVLSNSEQNKSFYDGQKLLYEQIAAGSK